MELKGVPYPLASSNDHSVFAVPVQRSVFEAMGALAAESPTLEGMASLHLRSEQSLEYLLMAQDLAGRRMGMELHDSTRQLLLALRLGISELRRTSRDTPWEERFVEIAEIARQIDNEIRAFSYLHYPAELGVGGLPFALRTLARGFGDRTGLQVSFEHVSGGAVISDVASIALLRIAQEALMNVHRHANASEVLALARSRV